MEKPKENGGVGLKDVRTMTMIKGTIQIWMLDQSLWEEWMRMRYIKGRRLNDITKIHSQLPMCYAILRTFEITKKCVDCNQEYIFDWKGIGMTPTTTNIYNTICLLSHPDLIYEGV